MLAKVIKPDHTAVTFKYDALGRRVEKCSSEKTTTFIWDGNTIFHEYFSVNDSEKSENNSENSLQNDSDQPANLITWVFNDGFVPSAKLTSEGNYSIISDYLGTPVEAYDEQGQKVWSAELDIYGRVQEFTGEQDFIPFRYQGQYEDVEIGLYYNRFRYYDPAQGNYTQVDPIGLAGGNPTLYGYVDNPNIWIDVFGLQLIKPGEDLFVGTYNQSYGANRKNGMNKTHTPHHVLQNALSPTTHGRGITINIKKDLHELTRTFRVPVDKSIGSLRDHLAADIWDLRKILMEASYDRAIVNQQLKELIRQNMKYDNLGKKGACK